MVFMCTWAGPVWGTLSSLESHQLHWTSPGYRQSQGLKLWQRLFCMKLMGSNVGTRQRALERTEDWRYQWWGKQQTGDAFPAYSSVLLLNPYPWEPGCHSEPRMTFLPISRVWIFIGKHLIFKLQQLKFLQKKKNSMDPIKLVWGQDFAHWPAVHN